MAQRTKLSSENLVALGAEKLARIALEEAGRNAPFKKLLATALAAAQGPDAVAAVLDRRLAGLERARGFVEWERSKAFAADLEGLLTAITDELGATDPAAATDRLIRFLACAGDVFDRVDDSSGQFQGLFEDGALALPGLVARLPEDDRVGIVELLVPRLHTGFGLVDVALRGLIPILPQGALARLDAILAAAMGPGIPPRGEAFTDWQRQARHDGLVRARQAIADVTGDLDAFIALEGQRTNGPNSLAVADRLLAAGRLDEALRWVRRPVPRGIRAMTMAEVVDGASGTDLADRERVLLEIRVLKALGRMGEAQDLRWRMFEATLDTGILRDHIADLDDFAEFDVLDRAFAIATAHPNRHRALAFLLAWPRLDLAAKLVVDRRGTWAGQYYAVLGPAAEALASGHAVAATILYRALLDDILARGTSTAYPHAARYLARLDALDIAEAELAGATLTDHSSYRAALMTSHGRKRAFWALVEKRPESRRGGKPRP